MSVRSVMVWSGGLLATAGLLLMVSRLVAAHQHVPVLGAMGATPYFGIAAAAVVVGVIATLGAPPDRRARGRVRLDERPVHEENTLRPAHQGTPTTHGMATRPTVADAYSKPSTKPQAAAAQAPPGAAATPRGTTAAESAGGATSTVQETRPESATPRTAGMEAPERPAWGTRRSGHPNDAIGEPGAAGGGAWTKGSSQAAPSPRPRQTPKTLEADDADLRVQARRSQLMERLEELESKANQAKVRFGLGKVSAAGYRQYLAEVDRERMMIESELMESEG